MTGGNEIRRLANNLIEHLGLGNRWRFVALVIVMVAVGIGLSVAWEFVIEDYVAEELLGDLEGIENTWKKWEDVAEGLIFVVLAVILPLLLLRNAITRRQLVEGQVLERTAEIRQMNEALVKEITERKRAEEDRRQALIRAEEASHAKSEFLATMSHELRTPLNAILGFADILSHQYFGPTSEKYKEYAEDIQSSGEHLLTLVNEILDLSTIEAGKQSLVKEKLSALEIVTECERIIEEKARSNGIDLVTKVPKDLPPLYADKRASKQILLNLLSNAVKFTPEGGKIMVSVKASKKDTTFKIADTGKGIPADKLLGLTDPFSRGEHDPYLAEEGWGLGLTRSPSP